MIRRFALNSWGVLLEMEGVGIPKPAKLTLEDLFGSIKSPPDSETIDFEDQIEEAMQDEADRIVGRFEILPPRSRRRDPRQSPPTAVPLDSARR
jgi:hypothetical protein